MASSASKMLLSYLRMITRTRTANRTVTKLTMRMSRIARPRVNAKLPMKDLQTCWIISAPVRRTQVSWPSIAQMQHIYISRPVMVECRSCHVHSSLVSDHGSCTLPGPEYVMIKYVE